jgi:hypothetical protein
MHGHSISHIEMSRNGVRAYCYLLRGEWPACWEPQEEGVMSIAENTTEGDAC